MESVGYSLELDTVKAAQASDRFWEKFERDGTRAGAKALDGLLQGLRSIEDVGAAGESASERFAHGWESRMKDAARRARADISRELEHAAAIMDAQVRIGNLSEVRATARRLEKELMPQIKEQGFGNRANPMQVGASSMNKKVQAAFQVQQMVEDFSFAGFRGISNNIGMLAASMGGVGGLAALAALTGANLYSMAAAEDAAGESAEKLKKSNDALTDSMQDRLGIQDVLYEATSRPPKGKDAIEDLIEKQAKYEEAQRKFNQVGGSAGADTWNRLSYLDTQQERLRTITSPGIMQSAANRAMELGISSMPDGLQKELDKQRLLGSNKGNMDVTRTAAQQRLVQLMKEESSLREQLGILDGESAEAYEKRFKEARKEVDLTGQLVDGASRRLSEIRRIEDAELRIAELESRPASKREESLKEQLKTAEALNKELLKSGLASVSNSMHNGLTASWARTAGAENFLANARTDGERQRALATLDREEATRRDILRNAQQFAQQERAAFDVEAARLDVLSQVEEKQKEIDKDLESQIKSTQKLIDKEAERTAKIREMGGEVRDSYASNVYSGQSGIIDNRLSKIIERIDKEYDAYTRMLDHAQGVSDQEKGYLKQWADQRKEFLHTEYEEQAQSLQDNLLRKRIQTLKSQAETAVSMGGSSAARGESELAQRQYEKALKYLEDIQSLQFGGIGQGTTERDQQLMNAASQSQKMIEDIIRQMEAASTHAQQLEVGRLNSLKMLKQEVQDITLVGPKDEAALEKYKARLIEIGNIKAAIEKGQDIAGNDFGAAGVANPVAGGGAPIPVPLSIQGADTQNRPVWVVDVGDKKMPGRVDGTAPITHPNAPMSWRERKEMEREQRAERKRQEREQKEKDPDAIARSKPLSAQDRWEKDQAKAEQYREQAQALRQQREMMPMEDRWNDKGSALYKRIQNYEAMAKRMENRLLNPNASGDMKMYAGGPTQKELDDAKIRAEAQFQNSLKKGPLPPGSKGGQAEWTDPQQYFRDKYEAEMANLAQQRATTQASVMAAMRRESQAFQDWATEREAQTTRMKAMKDREQYNKDMETLLPAKGKYLEAPQTTTTGIMKQKGFKDFLDSGASRDNGYGLKDAFTGWWARNKPADLSMNPEWKSLMKAREEAVGLDGDLQQAQGTKAAMSTIDSVRADELVRAAELALQLERAARAKLMMGAVGGGGSLSVPVAGARAAGGPVSGGLPYLIGERGAELFVPHTNGTIVDAYRTSRWMQQGGMPGYAPSTQGGNAGVTNISIGNLSVPVASGVNLEDLQRQAVAQARASRLRKG